MTPINPMYNMPPEPCLWDAEQKASDNENYCNEGIDFNKAQQKLRNELYGIKEPWNEEDVQKKSEKSADATISNAEKEILEGSQDSIYTPLLKNLTISGHIPKETSYMILGRLSEAKSPKEEKIIFKGIVEDMPNSSIKDSITDWIDHKVEKVTEETFEKTDFYSHAQDLSMHMDTGIGGLEIMLAENYISIPDVNGNVDIKQNMLSTFDISINQILQESGNDFKIQNGTLIKEMREETNLLQKYLFLKNLYHLDLKRDAKLWWKKASIEIAQKKKSLKKEAEEITQQIKAARESQNADLVLDLEQQKEKIIFEGRAVEQFTWDIFVTGELDKNQEGAESWK